ncbi:uncharacterized protein PSFLO_07521 [Pseudozyma flocculosa]|uniref:Uncharacterized protein n=1 Tax=Pseudozyma flocculosa TaxID=84751 RepID=A0A5C3FCF8_9BASI|nr:uncharacterized protein PSFLO_07521 [Pseudozyma flocculosa]
MAGGRLAAGSQAAWAAVWLACWADGSGGWLAGPRWQLAAGWLAGRVGRLSWAGWAWRLVTGGCWQLAEWLGRAAAAGLRGQGQATGPGGRQS